MNTFTRTETQLAEALAKLAADFVPRYAQEQDRHAALTAVFDLAKEKAIELLQERKC